MFEVIDGQRHLLECALIEAICLGDMATYAHLSARLRQKTNLVLIPAPVPKAPTFLHPTGVAPI
jgi:hypothetical protein